MADLPVESAGEGPNSHITLLDVLLDVRGQINRLADYHRGCAPVVAIVDSSRHQRQRNPHRGTGQSQAGRAVFEGMCNGVIEDISFRKDYRSFAFGSVSTHKVDQPESGVGRERSHRPQDEPLYPPPLALP